LFAVTVIGKDQPGIVAAATKALFELGCNLEDASSTILGGHFSMMLLVRASDVDAGALRDSLRAATEPLGLVITVGAVEDADKHIPPPTHAVSVYGADRPGIVYRVADAVATAGANITDLTSRVIGSDDHPVYALMLEVSIEGADLDAALAVTFQGLRDELGVEVTMHPIDADVL
jgi:glycine cleavage system transcriptional repressor